MARSPDTGVKSHSIDLCHEVVMYAEVIDASAILQEEVTPLGLTINGIKYQGTLVYE